MSPADILIARAAEAADTTPAELLGPRRHTHLVEARWSVMLALSERGWSAMRIGRRLGGRDHTTVLRGMGQAAKRRATDAAFADLCARVRA